MEYTDYYVAKGKLEATKYIIMKIIILLFIGFFITSCDNNKKQYNRPLKIGDMLDISDFDLICINQGEIEKDKLILFDFWATWCGPCIASFPHLEKLQEKYSDDLQIIAISDEKIDVVNNFLIKKNFKLSFFNDVDEKLFIQFNISHRPTSCLISKKGEFIWAGSSKDFEQVLTDYLNSGEISKPYITEFNKAFYNQDSDFGQESKFDNYSLSEGTDPKLYFAKNQKNENELINIKYVSVPVTEVVIDFLKVDNLSLINNRPELDTILLNFEAKSKILTYGQGKNKILEDIKNIYNFNINIKSKNADVHLLSIIDENVLENNIETIEGGGMVERKDGEHLITRLSLNQLASYLQNRLKIYIQFEGINDSKYNFIFDDFENLEALRPQLNKIGISLSKHLKYLEYFEIN